MQVGTWVDGAGDAPRRKAIGLALVLGLHAALAWVLLAASGTALRAVEPVRDAVQVLLMEPPRTLPAQVAAPVAPSQGSPARTLPKPQVATPAHAPAPVTEMMPPAPPAALPQAVPAAAALQAQGAAPRAEIAREGGAEAASGSSPQPAIARAVVPPGAATTGAATPAPASSQAPRSVGELCPGLVKAVPPARAVRAGLGGTVLARATVLAGRVVRVDILRSEPFGLFDAAVRQAMMQYRCHDQGDALLVAEQLFEFKLAD